MRSTKLESPAMQSHFVVTSAMPPVPPKPADTTPGEMEGLLRQLLEVQREQLAHLKQQAASQDASARWRALMARWREDHPDLPEGCKLALPILERAYGGLVASLVEELRDHGDDALDSEFALQDFLDRYGMRLGQLGNILNLVGPLADAGGQSEASS